MEGILTLLRGAASATENDETIFRTPPDGNKALAKAALTGSNAVIADLRY